MTSAYSQDRDVLNTFDISKRPQGKFRYAQPVTLDSEMSAYGPIFVTNSGASVETINVILASNTSDDTSAVSFHIPAGWAGVLPVVARRVLSSGTGSDITAVCLA